MQTPSAEVPLEMTIITINHTIVWPSCCGSMINDKPLQKKKAWNLDAQFQSGDVKMWSVVW